MLFRRTCSAGSKLHQNCMMCPSPRGGQNSPKLHHVPLHVPLPLCPAGIKFHPNCIMCLSPRGEQISTKLHRVPVHVHNLPVPRGDQIMSPKMPHVPLHPRGANFAKLHHVPSPRALAGIKFHQNCIIICICFCGFSSITIKFD